MDSITDAQVEQILHSQKIARKIGASQVAVEVYGWAIKNAAHVPNDALQELFEIVRKEPE